MQLFQIQSRPQVCGRVPTTFHTRPHKINHAYDERTIRRKYFAAPAVPQPSEGHGSLRVRDRDAFRRSGEGSRYTRSPPYLYTKRNVSRYSAPHHKPPYYLSNE